MYLRSLRLERGLSQAALAELMRTTQQTIARWEAGKSQINILQLKGLAAVLGVTVNDLLGPTDTIARPAHETGAETAGRRITRIRQHGRAQGVLSLECAGKARRWPLGGEGVALWSDQLQRRRPSHFRTQPPEWLLGPTLDNRYLFINPRHLSALELLRSDDGRTGASGQDRDVELHVLHGDGRERLLCLSSGTAVELAMFELEAFALPPSVLIDLGTEAGQSCFVNLDQVALIETSLPLFERLLAQADRAA